MPSDDKKRRAAKKKEAAKTAGKRKPADTAASGDPPPNTVTNGIDEVVNGDDDAASTSENSEAKALHPKIEMTDEEELMAKLEAIELENRNARSITGVLTSHPRSRDVKIEGVTVTFYGRELVVDTKIELNCGRRYGLVGLNGSGKSTILDAIANREVTLPDSMDLFMLNREMPASNKSALQAVMDVDQERQKLEAEAEELAVWNDDESHDKLMEVYERLDEMESDKAELKCCTLLRGLGFTHQMMHKPVKDFSGGWRMRIALARALFLTPSLLLLDEPTNHLDLDACVWLEEELKTYKRILVIVSHSQDFMNGVCTNIIHLEKKKLRYYGGNYDAFMKTRIELLENQMKRYTWEQNQLQHMKDYVARFGHGSAKLARQAQSKEKTMAKMVAGGLTEKASTEMVKQFYFFDPGTIPPPVIMVQHVSFQYDDGMPWIYKDLDFGLDMDTRVALVGPNGAGKSTLLKLLAGDIMPTDGLIRRHSHVKIGRYHQHLHEQLDVELSALEYMQRSYPDVKEKEDMRKIIGRYGLTGREQVCPMKQLSDGQRCRVSFAWLAWQTPHLLLLDEPTNHLDMESIDALAEAINNFPGGMILVSHDFRLVSQVVDEIWICNHQVVTKWDGDIFSFKRHLRKQIEKEQQRSMRNSTVER